MNEKIETAIDNERIYQDNKWGTVEEHPHTVGEWVLIMEEFIRKARLAWVSGVGDSEALFRILQVSSLGIACMEQHGAVERNQRPSVDTQKMVNEVADLVAQFFSLVGYAGEHDYIPHLISHCLKEGHIRCPRCNATGKTILPDKECSTCNGKGSINFVIPSLTKGE